MMTAFDRKPVGGVNDDARTLDDLLRVIAERAELLIAGLDPSGPSFRHAQEIGHAAASARRRAAADIDRPLPDRREASPVLVVDDEPGIREFIRLVLLQAGHDVVTAAGPRAALDTLRRQPGISLMLLDIIMPEMDGYEVAEEARRIAPGIHIVFLSTFAPDPACLPGNDSFLAKPFSRDALNKIVKKALSD